MAQPRDYARESETESDERKRNRAARNRARRKVRKQLTEKHGAAVADKMMANKDVGHKKALALGGSKTNLSNLKLQDPSENRSDKRGLFTGKKTTRPKNPLKD
jgi:hypothetical protein